MVSHLLVGPALGFQTPESGFRCHYQMHSQRPQFCLRSSLKLVGRPPISYHHAISALSFILELHSVLRWLQKGANSPLIEKAIINHPKWYEVSWASSDSMTPFCALSHFSLVRLCAILRTVTQEAPLSMRTFQARRQEQAAISSSRASSPPRDRTRISHVSHTDRRVLYHLAPPGKPVSP